MTIFAYRRRLLAGLVLTGLAPIEALAQTSTSSGTSSGTTSTPSAPLPDCVLDKVSLAAGVTLSAEVKEGGFIDGFVLDFSPAAALFKPTGLKITGGGFSLQLECQLSSTALDGAEIVSLGLFLPEVKTSKDDTLFNFGPTTLKLGKASIALKGAGGGVGGTIIPYRTTAAGENALSDADFKALTAALRAGGAMSFTGAGKDGQAGKATFTYAFPKLAPLFAAAAKKLDTLVDDSKAGRCKIPTPVSYGSPKFCTTAAVEVLGLGRDCWELTALHRFRDWMLGDRQRARIAIDYNHRAPGLVYALSRRPDARRIWVRFYFAGVLPAAALSRLGLNAAAFHVYNAACQTLVRLAKLAPA